MPGPAGNDLDNMEFFTIAAGISVHVFDTEEAGKPCLVLLHGYLETMYVFNELTEALRSSYRVIVIDMPGHGLTDSAPADEAGKRINSLSFCARVVAGLLDKCGVEKAWIAGHSMGGYVAQQFLSDFPERTEGVILLCSHPWPDAPEKAADREMEKQGIRAGKLMTIAAASIPRMYYEENLRACDEKVRETIELCETHDPEGICSLLDGLRMRPDLRPVLAEACRPVLLIHGDHDNFLSLSRVEEMKNLFPKMHFALIPDAGHNAFIERQDACVEEILRFAPVGGLLS